MFWPSTTIPACSLPVREQLKLSRLNSITTTEARAWQTLMPGQHEIPSSTWCTWLQVWLGVPVFDSPGDGTP